MASAASASPPAPPLPRHIGLLVSHILKAAGTTTSSVLYAAIQGQEKAIMGYDIQTHTYQIAESGVLHALQHPDAPRRLRPCKKLHGRCELEREPKSGKLLCGNALDFIFLFNRSRQCGINNGSFVQSVPDDPFHDSRFFRIMVVREPCEYSASMWRFATKSRRHVHGHVALSCAAQHSSFDIHNESSGQPRWVDFWNNTFAPSFGWLSYRLSTFFLSLYSQQDRQLGGRGNASGWDGERFWLPPPSPPPPPLSPPAPKRGKRSFRPPAPYDISQACPAMLPSAEQARIANFLKTFDAVSQTQVDCWCHVESFAADFAHCLRAYLRRNPQSHLNLSAAQEALYSGANETELRQNAVAASTVKPGTRDQGTSCDELFQDPAAAAYVWEREAPLATALGYHRCCGGYRARRIAAPAGAPDGPKVVGNPSHLDPDYR